MGLGAFHRQPGIFALRGRHGAKAGLFCDYRADPPLHHPERGVDQRTHPHGNPLSRSLCFFHLPATHPDPCGRRGNDHPGPDIQGARLESGNIFRRMGKFIPQAVPLIYIRDPLHELIGHRPGIQRIQPGGKAHLYYEPRMRRWIMRVIILLGVVLAAALNVRRGWAWESFLREGFKG